MIDTTEKLLDSLVERKYSCLCYESENIFYQETYRLRDKCPTCPIGKYTRRVHPDGVCCIHNTREAVRLIKEMQKNLEFIESL